MVPPAQSRRRRHRGLRKEMQVLVTGNYPVAGQDSRHVGWNRYPSPLRCNQGQFQHPRIIAPRMVMGRREFQAGL